MQQQSTLNCLAALTAAYSDLHSWRLRLSVCILYSSDSVNCPCCFLHPDSSGVCPNTLQQPDGACPVPPAISAAHALSRKQKLLCYFGLLFCWLFWFLYQFPGVLTPDSISQFSQATGLIPFSNHHPILHTLLFSLFYHIGFFLTGSINTGIACYVLFQMCTMAAIETYTLSLLARSGASRLWLILSFCFWGLVPFHAIFAVTVWKDILFSGFMLLYLCFLYELLCNPDNRPGIWAGLSLSGFFVCTLRSNGLYIFLFTLPFVLFAFRRTWKKCLPCRSAYSFYP